MCSQSGIVKVIVFLSDFRSLILNFLLLWKTRFNQSKPKSTRLANPKCGNFCMCWPVPNNSTCKSPRTFPSNLATSTQTIFSWTRTTKSRSQTHYHGRIISRDIEVQYWDSQRCCPPKTLSCLNSGLWTTMPTIAQKSFLLVWRY